MRLVQIVWRDSGLQHENGWMTAPQIKNKTPFVTMVGYIVHDGEADITVAMGHSEELGLYYGIHTVWRPAIISVTEYLGDGVAPCVPENTQVSSTQEAP